LNEVNGGGDMVYFYTTIIHAGQLSKLHLWHRRRCRL